MADETQSAAGGNWWNDHVVVRSVEPAAHLIDGEPFWVSQAPDCGVRLALTHRCWSLCGFGDTLAEAERDLWDRAAIIAPAYVGQVAECQTDEAQRLTAFLARNVALRSWRSPTSPSSSQVKV